MIDVRQLGCNSMMEDAEIHKDFNVWLLCFSVKRNYHLGSDRVMI